MAITAINITEETDFISPSDPDRDNKKKATIWSLRNLDSRQMGIINDGSTDMIVDRNNSEDDVKVSVNAQQANFKIVSFALVGWKNFKNTDGTEVEHKTVKVNMGGKSYTKLDDRILALIPSSVIAEIAEEVNKVNNLSETEEGN